MSIIFGCSFPEGQLFELIGKPLFNNGTTQPGRRLIYE